MKDDSAAQNYRTAEDGYIYWRFVIVLICTIGLVTLVGLTAFAMFCIWGQST